MTPNWKPSKPLDLMSFVPSELYSEGLTVLTDGKNSLEVALTAEHVTRKRLGCLNAIRKLADRSDSHGQGPIVIQQWIHLQMRAALESLYDMDAGCCSILLDTAYAAGGIALINEL